MGFDVDSKTRNSMSSRAEDAFTSASELAEKERNGTVRQDKPVRDWTLGEVQEYCFRRGTCHGCIFEADGGICKLAGGEDVPADWNLSILSKEENAALRTLGVKWVTRNLEKRNDGKLTTDIQLWYDKPTRHEEDGSIYFSNAYMIGTIYGDLLQSIKPGDCVMVRRT